MSTTTPQLKRHNHRVHPCTVENKNELLKVLLEKNSSLNIIVVTANDAEALKEVVQNEKITVMNDTDLAAAPELTCDMLISYDLPEKGLIYMGRISHTTTHALILLDKNEQKSLYPIETLIGRSLMQENIKGFEDLSLIPKPKEEKRSFDRDDRPKRNFDKDDRPKRNFDKDDRPKRNFDKDDRPKRNFDKDDKPKRNFDKDDRPKRDYKKDDTNPKTSDRWAKKDKAPSKYIGKDENGKSIFSGKTGERNHGYNGKPKDPSAPRKTPRKINIKPKKPSTES